MSLSISLNQPGSARSGVFSELTAADLAGHPDVSPAEVSDAHRSFAGGIQTSHSCKSQAATVNGLGQAISSR